MNNMCGVAFTPLDNYLDSILQISSANINEQTVNKIEPKRNILIEPREMNGDIEAKFVYMDRCHCVYIWSYCYFVCDFGWISMQINNIKKESFSKLDGFR
eukprot:254579_1